ELGEEVGRGFEVLVAKARRGLPNEHEWTYVRKDGARLPVLLNVTGLRDANGEITGFLGIASDITQRKRAEDDLRASEEKLRKLFELAPVGILLTTFEGRLVEFNDAFSRITGYSSDELLELDYRTLTPAEHHAEGRRQIALLAKSGRFGPYQTECVTKSGARIPVRLNGAKLTDR